MNSKERVLAAIRRTPADRAPRFLWVGSGAAENMHKELGMDLNEADFFVKNDVLQTWLTINKQMMVTAGEGEQFVDEFGITWQRDGYYNAPITHPFADLDDEEMASVTLPDPYDPNRYTELEKLITEYGDEYFIGADVSGTLFEPAYHLRSMENILMDMASESEEADILLDKLMDFSTAIAVEAVKKGADWIWLGDDMGTQISMIISPDMWRKYFKPRMKKIIDAIRAEKEDAIIAYHSCGSIYPIIGDIAEIGIDVLNPLQESAADMEHAKIKEEYGDKLTFMCGLDTQTFLRDATPEETYQAMCQELDLMNKGQGYIGAVSHTIQHDLPVPNIMAIIKALDEYDYEK